VLDPEERRKIIADFEAEADVQRIADSAQRRVVPIRSGMAPQGTTVNVPDGAPVAPSTVSDDLESHWLPAPVRDWVDAVASFAGVPKTMPIAAALCAAATVVQGRASVELAPGVVVPLTLWWCVLARTGGRKSTVMNMAIAPIVAMQESEKRRLLPDIAAAENEIARLDAQIQRMRRATKAHAYTEGAQEHLTQLRELEASRRDIRVPVPARWIYDNINPAMLPPVLQRSVESDDGIARMAIWGEEGTFLANVLGRDSGKPVSETLNQGYSGSALNLVRKLEGSKSYVDVTIDRIFISLCVFTQPHYREKLRNQELSDNGFLGRLLISECWVGPIPKEGTVSPPSESVLKGYTDWLVQLAQIPVGTVYRLSDAQRARLSRLRDDADERVMAGEDGQGWMLRSAERIAKIVALCGLSDVSENRVPTALTDVFNDYGDIGQVSELSELSEHPAHQTAGAREDIDLEYLIQSLYSRYLAAAQAQEPASVSTTRDGLRQFRHIRQISKVGDIVTSRQLSRVCSWRSDRAIAAAYELVEMGVLEVAEQPVARGRRTIKEVFRVVRLDLPGSVDS
jgi:hypothetical protein